MMQAECHGLRGECFMKWLVRTASSLLFPLLIACSASAQAAFDCHFDQVPAVSGYEQPLIEELRAELRPLSPKTDNVGNLWVTFGSGSPQRLLVTPVDEPGYVVSEITPDGYLRVQRLPQAAPNPVFDTLHFAQTIWVMTRSGKKVPGVFAGLSIHLQPARVNPPKMNHPDEMYVDLGATGAADVHAAGVDLLDPIALQRKWFPVGQGGEAGAAAGDRFGCTVLSQLLERIKDAKAKGTTTVAFLTQQWTGGRGLNRLLEETKPDEMIFVGRMATGGKSVARAGTAALTPGDGVLLGVEDASAPLSAFPGEIKAIAEADGERVTAVSASLPRIAGYAKPNAFPERFAQFGIPTLWPVTPGESISSGDSGNLERLLEAYLQVPKSTTGGLRGGSGGGTTISDLKALVDAYGASGHEENVRKVVLNRLDPRLQKEAETDADGNLILHLGDRKPDAKSPRIAFVAHMDEIGYEVKKIENDGRLSYPFWEEAIQNTFWGMLSSFIKPMGILLAGCSSCRQVGISRDSNGRMGRTRWKSPCTFTSARAPRKKRRSSESKWGIGSPFPRNIAPCWERAQTRAASMTGSVAPRLSKRRGRSGGICRGAT